MIAAHLDSLLFFLLVAVAVLCQFLAKTAGKTGKDQSKRISTPTPRTPTPMRRAPAESDEDRIRKLLEALGQPPTSKPPPPVVPRTNIPPRPLAPVQPPVPRAWKVIRRERRKPNVIRRETPPPEIVKRTEEVFPPAMTVAPAFEVHEGPLPIEPPPISKTPVEAYAAPKAFGVPKSADLKTNVAILLASKSGLRDAIILREVFGPPRSLQALDLGT